jgi:exodeoxyribonuclease VII large subunit
MPAEPAASPRPTGIPGVSDPGPFAVGAYAAKLRDELRKRTRVQIFGEVWNLRPSKARVYFELRDTAGAVPCAMWRDAFDALGLDPQALVDGTQVVVAGGPDYYVGGRTASPSFSFDVTGLRVAGEGDLLAQLEALRRTLAAEGLFEPQKLLTRQPLPRSVGVVTGEGGKARDDILAALQRRGWAGRLVWAFAPVQDRHAAPAITRALQDLAATGAVDVIVVARGGGSMADLFAFCDETLCRTVAMLSVPVIASVGHHTDRPLIDDVAAERCSTPTHAAEAAVPLHPGHERERLGRSGVSLAHHAQDAVVRRARTLATLSAAPARHVERERTRLHQRLRELRASAGRQVLTRRAGSGRYALVLERKATAAGGPEGADRRRALDAALAALAAHDPDRTLARGYALVELLATPGQGEDPGVITTADDALRAGRVRVRFADGPVAATIEPEEPEPT